MATNQNLQIHFHIWHLSIHLVLLREILAAKIVKKKKNRIKSRQVELTVATLKGTWEQPRAARVGIKSQMVLQIRLNAKVILIYKYTKTRMIVYAHTKGTMIMKCSPTVCSILTFRMSIILLVQMMSKKYHKPPISKWIEFHWRNMNKVRRIRPRLRGLNYRTLIQ